MYSRKKIRYAYAAGREEVELDEALEERPFSVFAFAIRSLAQAGI